MNPTLLAHHIVDLRASGLTDETIAAAGFHSLSAVEVRESVGMDAGPALAIPYLGVPYSNGSPYVRVRLDTPFPTSDGHSARYLTRKGEPPRLYVTPDSLMPTDWRTDTTVRLYFTEGEKKALAMVQGGLPCLGVAGVWAWMMGGKPISDFDEIVWAGREVVVVGDSDLRQNAQAAKGLKRLCRGLISRGAHAKLVFLPPDGEGKVGADDFLVKYGPEAFAKVLAEATHPDPNMPALEWDGDVSRADQATPVLRIIELRDFLADTTPLPPDVIGGIARAGTVFSIFGAPGSGKSFAGAELCLSTTVGGDFLGRFPCTKGLAVLCEQERAPHLVRERLRALVEGTLRPADAAPLYVIPLQDLRLDTPEAQQAFRAQMLDLAPKLIVIDTAISVAGSINFLDPNQVRAWMRFFHELAIELGGTICLICHCPKWSSKEPQLASLFGSEDFGAALDFALATVILAPHTFRLKCVKNSWGDEQPDLTFSVGPGESGLVLTSTAGHGGVRRILLHALTPDDWTKGAELPRLVVAAGYSDRAARDALTKLVEEGLIEIKNDPSHKGWYLYRIAGSEAQ